MEKKDWISVEDRLPEYAGYYLAAIKTANYPYIAITFYLHLGAGKWKTTLNGLSSYYEVTHWMPLPEPPEVSNE